MQATAANPAQVRHSGMPWFPAVPPALAASEGGRIRRQRRAGLPRLLHKLFLKVLRLRPAAAGAAEHGFYGYRMTAGDGDEEGYCYYYSYGGAGSSWAGVLSSIPEEELDDDGDGDSSEEEEEEEGTPDAAVLRKSKSERFVVTAPDEAAAAAAVVRVEVLL